MQDTNPLKSTSHIDIVYSLSDTLIEAVRGREPLGGKAVADALTESRNIIWPVGADIPEAEKRARFEALLNGIGENLPVQARDALRSRFLECYARMGHLYELSGLVARDNYFQEIRTNGGNAPGSSTEFIDKAETAQEAVAALNHPVFNMVMTAHPTNMNSKDTIAALRRLGVAIDAARMEGKSSINVSEAIHYLLDVPLLPQKDGQDTKLSVHDETELVLYFMRNAYKDLPGTYKKFDAPLARKTPGYKPLSLHLKLQYESWGSSGDKDGNKSVNADTTLEALVMHKREIVGLYRQAMDELGLADKNCDAWRARFKQAETELGDVLSAIAGARNAKHALTPEELHDYSHRITQLGLDSKAAKAFTGALEDLYSKSQTNFPEKSASLLDLCRRVRTFGFHFARIEYRETAEEYTRVLEAIIPGYHEMDEEARSATLTRILETPGEAKRLLGEVEADIIAQGRGRPYDNDDARPIAYHTLERMKLAGDHPDMVTDNVLAECKTTSNLLEALFLQAAVADENGKRPELGIIPLFEDPETMQHVGEIMATAYANPAYAAHLKKLQANSGGDMPVQQVQIAHSDNTRRSGLPAARALIMEGHNAVRAAGANAHPPVESQFFEGGSQSDPYRGGVRSITSAVDMYGLQDFAKFTFQGGDLLNYMNYPPSQIRLNTRQMVHSAEHALREKTQSDIPQTKSTPIQKAADRIALDALKMTLPDYQENIFQPERIGIVLGALEDKNGNNSSRAPTREPLKSPDENKMAFEKVKDVKMGGQIRYVSPFTQRTITFSEALQHGGLVPTWLGAHTLKENILTACKAHWHEFGHLTRQELSNAGLKPNSTELPAKAVRFLYQNSPTFKDVMDRFAFGGAQSNLEGLLELHPELNQEKAFIDHLKEEYRAAADLSFAALCGSYPESHIQKDNGEISLSQLRQAMLSSLPHLDERMQHKTAYMDLLLSASAIWKGDLSDHELRLLHLAKDISTHGRYLEADDPAMGKHKKGQQQFSAKPSPPVSSIEI